MINGKIHYEWSFSIAMLNYQRVIRVATWFFVHVVQDAAPLTHFGRNCLLETEVKEAPVGL